MNEPEGLICVFMLGCKHFLGKSEHVLQTLLILYKEIFLQTPSNPRWGMFGSTTVHNQSTRVHNMNRAICVTAVCSTVRLEIQLCLQDEIKLTGISVYVFVFQIKVFLNTSTLYLIFMVSRQLLGYLFISPPGCPSSQQQF